MPPSKKMLGEIVKIVKNNVLIKGFIKLNLKQKTNYAFNYKFAKRYGLVVELDKPVIFYFETITPNTNL